MAFIRYFIAVPRIILNDQTCSQTDKLVYGMINSLSNNKEYCYASNSYFANILGVKEKTIFYSINNLEWKKCTRENNKLNKLFSYWLKHIWKIC